MHKIEMDEEQEAFDETLRFIKSAPVSAVVILGTNGKMRVWGRGFETRAQRGWLRECLEQARKLLVE